MPIFLILLATFRIADAQSVQSSLSMYDDQVRNSSVVIEDWDCVTNVDALSECQIDKTEIFDPAVSQDENSLLDVVLAASEPATYDSYSVFANVGSTENRGGAEEDYKTYGVTAIDQSDFQYDEFIESLTESIMVRQAGLALAEVALASMTTSLLGRLFNVYPPKGGSFLLRATVSGQVNIPSAEVSRSAKLAASSYSEVSDDTPDKSKARIKPKQLKSGLVKKSPMQKVGGLAKGGLKWGFRIIKVYVWADVAVRGIMLLNDNDPGLSPLTEEIIRAYETHSNN